MTEPVIAAVEAAAAPLVQAAAKQLAPEAEQLLTELEHDAAIHFAALEAAIAPLAAKAEGASAHAIAEAQQHLAALLTHLHSVLGTPAAPSGVDPTPAAPAAQP